MKDKNTFIPKTATLCWDCQNAVRNCSWSKDFIPVDGWEAIPTKIREDNGKRLVDSFIVKKCPEFVADEEV